MPAAAFESRYPGKCKYERRLPNPPAAIGMETRTPECPGFFVSCPVCARYPPDMPYVSATASGPPASHERKPFESGGRGGDVFDFRADLLHMFGGRRAFDCDLSGWRAPSGANTEKLFHKCGITDAHTPKFAKGE